MESKKTYSLVLGGYVNGYSIIRELYEKELRNIALFSYGKSLGSYSNKINYFQSIGPGVKIISASHNLNDYDLHDSIDPIEIGDNCWFGADVIILPGVKLGDHTVVAAGAVVTKSFWGLYDWRNPR